MIDPMLGIAQQILSGAEALGASAISRKLSNEEIALNKEQNTLNINALSKFLGNDFESIASQQRTEIGKQYQDIYDSLMQTWGGQSVGYASADQEAVEGGSVRAAMGKTQGNVEYYFGSDRALNNIGGLEALAKTNLENDIANSRQQMQNAITSAGKANEYLDKATRMNNLSWLDKLELGRAQLEWDINQALGLNKNYNYDQDTYRFKDLISR